MQVPDDKICENTALELKFDFQVFFGRIMERDAMAQAQQERAMENEKKSATNPEAD
jgi:hypothetical protein